jgi:membrane protease YdiL (CAAX protease family)
MGSRPRMRRCAAATLIVAVWMALGWLLGADANTYLIMGVPLMVAFQLGVRRRPLHTLWVRNASHFQLGRIGSAAAVALAAAPAWVLARMIGAGTPDLVRVAWLVCALVGAVAAGFALRHVRAVTVRALLGCLATAGSIGAALMIATWFARSSPAPAGVAVGVKWFLLYLPVCFVLEEVFFRGMLDAYVHQPDETRGWSSAVFVSILWALWHLPIVPGAGAVMVPGLLVIHVAIGVPLALYWRRSGNLFVPATAHAFIDAVRNALLGS